jgi:hypothetical protein
MPATSASPSSVLDLTTNPSPKKARCDQDGDSTRGWQATTELRLLKLERDLAMMTSALAVKEERLASAEKKLAVTTNLLDGANRTARLTLKLLRDNHDAANSGQAMLSLALQNAEGSMLASAI